MRLARRWAGPAIACLVKPIFSLLHSAWKIWVRGKLSREPASRRAGNVVNNPVHKDAFRRVLVFANQREAFSVCGRPGPIQGWRGVAAVAGIFRWYLLAFGKGVRGELKPGWTSFGLVTPLRPGHKSESHHQDHDATGHGSQILVCFPMIHLSHKSILCVSCIALPSDAFNHNGRCALYR